MVSVIIPCYNSGKTISKCIESVIEQTYKNVEIIIIDDGSTDNSVETVKLIQGSVTDPFRLLHIIQKNSGPSSARNSGVMHSKGDYIAFLDSDDYWIKPNKLQEQIDSFKADCNIALIGYTNQKKNVDNSSKSKIISFENMCLRNPYITSSVMVKRNVMIDNLFNESKKYSEDFIVWLNISYKHRCLCIYDSVVDNINGGLYFQRKGLSSNLWKMEKGQLNNYWELYQTGKIKTFPFIYYCIFSILKYFRRIILKYMMV